MGKVLLYGDDVAIASKNAVCDEHIIVIVEHNYWK
jgi:hypothetical protein